MVHNIWRTITLGYKCHEFKVVNSFCTIREAGSWYHCHRVMHARVKSALEDTDTGRTVTLREAFGHEAGLHYILSSHVSPGGAYIPASAGRQWEGF